MRIGPIGIVWARNDHPGPHTIMKKSALTLTLLLPLLTGCLDLDFGFDSIDWGGSGGYDGGGWGGTYTPTLTVEGFATVGDYLAAQEEVTILVYAAGDTVTPVDSVMVYGGGGFMVDFGATPDADVCSHLARARRWDGVETELQALFDPVPTACDVGYHSASSFRVAGYEPLAEPFRISGRVFLDGAPAGDGSVLMKLFLRRAGAEYVPTAVYTDSTGTYAYETTDRATWYAACWGINAEGLVRGSYEGVYLGAVPTESCGNARTLPDVRPGTPLAAEGQIFRDSYGTPWHPADGTVTVRLVHASDTSIAPIDGQVLDDAQFRLWFAHGATPSCDWVVEASVNGTPEYRAPLNLGGGACYAPYWHGVELTPAGS